MVTYRLNGANNLARDDEKSSETEQAKTVPEPGPGQIKVRVTKVLVTGEDAGIYSGAIRARLPIIPGRFAVGIVADANGDPRFAKEEKKSEKEEKGKEIREVKAKRVLLHTFHRAPDTGTARKDFSADDYEVCGRTVNGFLRDFICLPPEELTIIPDALTDERALLVHHIALAKATAEKLGAQKGDHVAVIGANMLGILLCQLLIYQQVSPVLIDRDPSRLEFARRSGIYYTFPDDENLLDAVADITGGKLVSGAVYVTENGGGSDPAMPFTICARGANVVYCGMLARDVNLKLDLAVRKQLTLCGVPNGRAYLETAINLLLGDAFHLNNFSAARIPAENASALFRDYFSRKERDVSEINILSLI